MYQQATAADLPMLCNVWQRQLMCSEKDAKTILEQVAGLENIYLCQEENTILFFVAAIPVTMEQLPGVYLYGLSACSSSAQAEHLAGLLEYAKNQQTMKGKGFAVAAIPSQYQEIWEQQGFVPYFRRRHLSRSIRRNLWAQAQFDSITAPRLGQLRNKYSPESVSLPPEGLVVQLLSLYSQGATAVENEKGYGVFFEQGDTLYFTELFAQSDYDAQLLLEAARDRTGLERAEIVLPENSEICLGEGKLELYGMACFWGAQPPLRSGYLPLILDEKRGVLQT